MYRKGRYEQMKNRWIYFIAAVLMVFTLTGGALAELGPQLDNPLDMSNQGPNGSLQLMFAKMQLEQAEMVKAQALDRMEQIQKSQEEQKQVAGYLNEARQAQADARNSEGTSGMSDEMKQYMDSNGLAYDKTGDDNSMSADEWDTTINSLEGQLEKLGVQTQQQMINVQDFIGQYNSYYQGANQQLTNSQQTITSLARGMSLYGESDAGLAVTALVAGLVLGCVITLAAQKIGGKKGKT